jgi:hypothetical protein
MLRVTADVIIPNRRRLSSIYRHFLREKSFAPPIYSILAFTRRAIV